MNIKWSDEALESYDETLDYWVHHNKSYSYSNKIIDEVEKVKEEIKDSPYFLAQYIEINVLFLKVSLLFTIK